MSDEDFLSEVAAAAGGAIEPTDFTTVVKPEVKAPVAPQSHSDLVDDLTGEAKPKRETLTTKKKDPPPGDDTVAGGEGADTAPAEEGKDTTKAKPDDKTTTPGKKSVPYMDRFYPEDAKGNLLLSDGSVLAAAGNARAAVEGLKKEARDQRTYAQQQALANVELGKKFKELYGEFTTFQKNGGGAASLTKETGLAAHEITEAVKLMKLYKSEPLSAIKSLLTQAHARGIDVSSLGVKTSLDLPTLMRMMKENPEQVAQEDAAPSEEATLEVARKEVKGFISRNPDAVEHIQLIAAAKSKFPEATLDEIWIHLRQWQADAAAREDEEATKKALATRQNTTVVKKVTQQPDYSRMSFAEIAAQMKGELDA